MAEIIEINNNEVVLQVRVKLNGSMLEIEENIQFQTLRTKTHNLSN